MDDPTPWPGRGRRSRRAFVELDVGKASVKRERQRPSEPGEMTTSRTPGAASWPAKAAMGRRPDRHRDAPVIELFHHIEQTRSFTPVSASSSSGSESATIPARRRLHSDRRRGPSGGRSQLAVAVEVGPADRRGTSRGRNVRWRGSIRPPIRWCAADGRAPVSTLATRITSMSLTPPERRSTRQ